MLKEHAETVAFSRLPANVETDPAQKAFAVKHLTILKGHEAHAQTVNKMIQSVKNDKGDQPLKTSKDRNL